MEWGVEKREAESGRGCFSPTKKDSHVHVAMQHSLSHSLLVCPRFQGKGREEGGVYLMSTWCSSSKFRVQRCARVRGRVGGLYLPLELSKPDVWIDHEPSAPGNVGNKRRTGSQGPPMRATPQRAFRGQALHSVPKTDHRRGADPTRDNLAHHLASPTISPTI